MYNGLLLFSLFCIFGRSIDNGNHENGGNSIRGQKRRAMQRQWQSCKFIMDEDKTTVIVWVSYAFSRETNKMKCGSVYHFSCNG
ncbi:hypothetical protein MKW98_024300 [Papaver atlanticum]|uniref:Secreted protein n=1 Tax=Papaver atlanticum TaxID=357466 RepID=A0AAD4XN46_9MAGN|nr:hypothetical protein MKW98_024300 [Papaver atlanticum]